ncbi:MAG: helix-turn-helix domain-containing protein [Vicinamibacterales bacterium]
MATSSTGGMLVTVGTELRQAREQRGLTLRDVSERTNIRQSVLRAIEADDFARLPGGVITRGFVKLYAREVGLDPEVIWQRCAEQAGVGEPDRPDGNATATEPGHPSGTAAPAARPRSSMAPVVGALAALALIAIGYVLLRSPSENAAPAEPAPPAATAEPAATAVEPATTPVPSGKAPASPVADAPPASTNTQRASSEASEDRLRVDLHATGPCWVSATADGEQVVYRQMNPGDRQAISVTREIVLRVGMPGNLEISLNGQPLPPSASPGTPATLRMTPANYRELLRQ